MVEDRKIREEIKETVDHIPSEWLNEILEFIRQLESKENESDDILSYFGIWKDMDDDLINDLTINLHDSRLEPYIKFEELNEYFDTKQSTIVNKASEIRKMFKMTRMFDFDFMTEDIKERNPLTNMVIVNGFIVPLTSIPKEYQEIVKEARENDEQK